MPCRVEMPANEQVFGRFYRWRFMRGGHLQAGRGSIVLYILLLFFISGAVIFLGPSPVVLGTVLLLVAAYFGYACYYRPNQIFRSKPGAALNIEVTVFTDTGLARTVRSEEGGLPENTSVQYTALYKAVETKRDFYLFTSPGQAFLIDKAYFTKGDPATLRATLAAALGSRFQTKQRAG